LIGVFWLVGNWFQAAQVVMASLNHKPSRPISRLRYVFVALLAWALLICEVELSSLWAEDTPPSGEETSDTAILKPEILCSELEAQANARALPADFFVRLIWKESRFNSQALSPKGAQGIAQFMPVTAAERGLTDPFDPMTAIAESASYLADLAAEFGNIGLAAAL
jgi:soluble lytic murein transglycosylase-like protein